MTQFNIFIKHIPSGRMIDFKPFLTAFSDNFKSDWNQSYVMGRMDSIPTFKRTTRVINMSFDVPAASAQEGLGNLAYAKQLAKFLYPVYKEISIKNASQNVIDENNIPTPGANDEVTRKLFQKQAAASSLESQLNLRPLLRTMGSSPMLAIKFANLVSANNNEMLYGYLDGFNFKPDIEAGFFIDDCTNLIPKAFSVDLTFNVIHTEPLGWSSIGLDKQLKASAAAAAAVAAAVAAAEEAAAAAKREIDSITLGNPNVFRPFKTPALTLYPTNNIPFDLANKQKK